MEEERRPAMRQIRIQKQKVRYRDVRDDVLPLDPRDPDILRAKRLQRTSQTARRPRAA
jgi:hypothetical protein